MRSPGVDLFGLAAFRAELPDLTRGLPEIDIRIGTATGDVVVGRRRRLLVRGLPRHYPIDLPSEVFLERIAQFRATALSAEQNGVWSLVEK